MQQLDASYFISTYKMNRHPEGGHYFETYRSSETLPQAALPKRFSGDRNIATAIYFLLEGKEFSSFHRIRADEIWHFYHGAPVELFMISPSGELTRVLIGSDPVKGHHFQFMVPAGYWFASCCSDASGYSFVGCTVSPGFDFSDFELAKAKELSNMFPEHQALIHTLCRQ